MAVNVLYRTVTEIREASVRNTSKERCELAVIVLAAGKGSRMALDRPKVLVDTCQGPLIDRVLRTAAALHPEQIVVVTGHGKDEVQTHITAQTEQLGLKDIPVHFVVQPEQLGSGDAVKAALPQLEGFQGTVLILNGDVPLVRTETLQALHFRHTEEKATVTLTTVTTDTPGSYGRILRDSKSGQIAAIREARDCTEQELITLEINVGLYAVDSSFLKPAINNLTTDNALGEYLLTDIVERAVSEGQTVSGYVMADIVEAQGVNTLYHLMLVNQELRRRQIEELIKSGVIIEDGARVTIDPSVQIAAGVVIGPDVLLRGSTTIAPGVVLEGNSCLIDTTVGENTLLKFGIRAEGAEIGPECAVGPFAHLRPGTKLKKDVKVGNFVETKKAVLEDGAKASHLSYLGDCMVGTDANVGAGTITCNYDGYQKSLTKIGAGAFIGSNSSLVAPVKIGDGATVGAGSVITKEVGKDSLAVTRAEQKEIAGWSKRRRERG